MNEVKEKCALCGLAIEVKGFNVLTTEGLKLFCCAGCLSVDRLLNADKIQE